LAGGVLVLSAIAALFLPVTQSVLAPAEIVAADPLVITAPMDGVIEEIEVAPNAVVSTGTPLFRLNDAAVRSRYELAGKALEVARAEHRKAEQLAFNNPDSQAALAVLRAQIALKSSELAYAGDLLARSRVTAPAPGVVLFGDANDWRGRPVATGERVMILADPARVEVDIHLAVDDAIPVPAAASVRLFLNTAPLSPLPATVIRASYDAEPAAQGVLAFRLKARLDSVFGANPGAVLPRIGLKGTAKLYGEETLLFLHLFRKPLAWLRRTGGV